MAYLTSSATLAEVQAAYESNATYDLTASVTACKEFIQAGRMLIARMADQSSHGGTSLKESYQRIESQLVKAEAWLVQNDTASTTTSTKASDSVRFAAFENFR